MGYQQQSINGPFHRDSPEEKLIPKFVRKKTKFGMKIRAEIVLMTPIDPETTLLKITPSEQTIHCNPTRQFPRNGQRTICPKRNAFVEMEINRRRMSRPTGVELELITTIFRQLGEWR